MKKILMASLALAIAACGQKQDCGLTKSGLDPEAFVCDSAQYHTALYTLSNSNGMEVCITNLGARIVSLMAPDKDGGFRDVVLGFDNIDAYIRNSSAYGAVMGPYANRIAAGRFTLDGTLYELETNNGVNCLHGGSRTWQYSNFNVLESDASGIKLSVVKPDGEYGFPGNVTLTVTYTLDDSNRLSVAYEAETDAPTVINVTNHSFFNLSGNPQQPAHDNVLYINADCFTPTDPTQIPTGELRPVEGTPFDFRTPKAVGRDIAADDPQIAVAKGYDHNFVLNSPGDINVLAAKLTSPVSGISMEVYTDQPGVQMYSANNVNPALVGKDGLPFCKQAAVCLETQHYPDCPNHPEFPSTVLRPGEKFSSRTIFVFSVEK